MFKKVSLIIWLIIKFTHSSSSVDITCRFGNSDVNYYVVGIVYQCYLISPNIEQPETEITSIYGAHELPKTNDDVIGFNADGKVVHYFPKGIEGFFKNLLQIRIKNCQLKEIHQADLKPFPKLVFLNLGSNEIEILEEGLFDFNLELQAIGFELNKIVHIDTNIFDNLSKLDHFWFEDNFCINAGFDSKADVIEGIKLAKAQCVSSDFLDLDVKIKNLENEPINFSSNLDEFENILKNSKFFKFRPLNYKFENLKSRKFDDRVSPLNITYTAGHPQCPNSTLQTSNGDGLLKFCPSEQQYTALSTKIDDLDENFKHYMAEKFEKIDKELVNTRHKISVNFDEKIKLIEKRLMKKFEEMLEEKLEKILDEKLGHVIDARFGTK